MKRLPQVLISTLAGLIVALAIVWPRGQGPAVSTGFQPYPAADFSLTSHSGTDVSLSDFRGEPVALFFGYTHCPDVCPLTLAKLAEANAATSSGVTVLFVTVDPERDSAERLTKYLEALDPQFIGLRGTLEELHAVADSYGVYFDQNAENPAMFDHSARTFLINREGSVAESFLHDASAAEIGALLQVVAAGQ
jgi:protein SCO1/2